MSGKFMMNGIEYLGGGSGGGGGGGNVDDVLVNGISVVNEDKEAEIVSYKEVTQSEYEALPDTKLTDGIAYFIKDSTEAEGYPPLIYSIGEREVGVWIDGKPLYQKTLLLDNVTISANGFVTKDLSQFIDNLDLALFHKTVVMMNGSPIELPAVHAGNQLSSYDISCVLTENTLYLSRSSAGSITGDFKSTIWYTKTTDTAGQGIWAGNGAMAHHYSTDEVIVGTWIDGKPLYERVFETNYVPVQNDWVNTGIDATGMDKIISFIGHCYGTGYMFLTSFDEVQLYNNMVRITCGPNGVGRTYNLSILRYTKTTD